MRIIFCGARDWGEPRIVEWQLRQIRKRFAEGSVTIVHGAARGLDRIAGALAEANGFEVERHEAKWDRYGPKAAGAIRNAVMLDAGADAVYGYKNSFDWTFRRGGTEGMIEMGLRNDIPVEVWHYVGGDVHPGGYAPYEVAWPPPR